MSLIFFQFLWGWNLISILEKILGKASFNSFEDETQIVRFKITAIGGQAFQFLWGWNGRRKMPRRWKDVTLSIPLRMKPHHTPASMLKSLLLFQFLWGWNAISHDKSMKIAYLFQFLWGWNFNITASGGQALLSFNSFEDETIFGILNM